MDALEAEAEKRGTVSTTPINLCELYAGAYGAREPGRKLSKVGELVARLGVPEFGAGAARRYGELTSDEALRREPIGDFDMIIASIALEHREKLATRNFRHFGRVPELVVEEW
ncbi:MAG: type II toxin-antitoxin system VapC family toxin [Nitrososphaerota archaeon]|nr:type II toxin-antitoxin system VapC family toxin [Nitrososphaerota archaeon]MDG6940047.1 type II toxin-antitoxin system VapC family toxin [Nitrososphaerota archaeon]